MQPVSFQRTYSKTIRLWHWSSFIIVSLLLITVVIGKFFLNDFSNGFVIKEQLEKQGITINMQQAFAASSSLCQRVWKVHIFLGYVLTSLFAFRLLIEFFRPHTQKISFRLNQAWKELRESHQKRSAVHSLFVQVLYIVFYLLTAVMIGTGLWIALHDSSDASRELTDQIHQMKELHQQCFFGLLVFIFIHLAGVIRKERKEHQNLVSAMIHGGRKDILESNNEKQRDKKEAAAF
jgi:cytochrome b